MKRILAFLICFSLIASNLSGCVHNSDTEVVPISSETTFPLETELQATEVYSDTIPNTTAEEIDNQETIPFIYELHDPALLDSIEDQIYSNMVTQLDSSEYFIENIQAIYVPKEYLEELSYNSQKNIYFGYTQDELDSLFHGDRYIFKLNNDGTTGVEKMDIIEDSYYETILKNVMIGTGVILVCITISVVTAGTGSTAAISTIFAFSAKHALQDAVISGAVSAISTGITEGYRTGDFKKSLKAATLAGSESFKWGAIVGAISGGAQKLSALKGASRSGLTLNEAAQIQKNTKWSLSTIKNIHSTKECDIYKQAGLRSVTLPNGKDALIRDIKWDLKDEYNRTNIERIKASLSPIDENGIPYELHHIGQKADSPLAILTQAEHRSKGNHSILHYKSKGKGISSSEWAKQRHEFWMNLLEMSGRG